MLPKGRRPKQFGRIRPTLWQDTVLSELRDDVIGELVRSQLPNLLFGEFMLPQPRDCSPSWVERDVAQSEVLLIWIGQFLHGVTQSIQLTALQIRKEAGQINLDLIPL